MALLVGSAATLWMLIESTASEKAEPAVDGWQLVWPLKLNDWLRANTALANSSSSLITAWRTATNPVMAPSTRMVATKTHSVAIKAPQSSAHKRTTRSRIKHNLLPQRGTTGD